MKRFLLALLVALGVGVGVGVWSWSQRLTFAVRHIHENGGSTDLRTSFAWWVLDGLVDQPEVEVFVREQLGPTAAKPAPSEYSVRTLRRRWLELASRSTSGSRSGSTQRSSRPA